MIGIKSTDIVLGLALGLCLVGSLAIAHEDNWSAIAINTADVGRSPAYGIGGGDSKAEAIENAQKFCKEGDRASCMSVSVATYQDCGAVAAGAKSGGWGIGATRAEASSLAMSSCKDGECRIVAVACN